MFKESLKYKSGLIRGFLILSVISCIATTGLLAQSEPETSSLSAMETVILSTDRTIYLPGDEVLLMVWIAEADSYQPSGLSTIVRLEVTGSDGTVIIREELDVSNGIAENVLRIPGTVSTGWYQIRAYTNWMRNFPSSFYSSRNIKIVNPSDLKSIHLADQPDSVLIRLIPEGQGQLRGGLENNCAVWATDLSGNPVAFTGALANSGSDTLAVFETGHTGWGLIKFVPDKRESYRIVSLSPEVFVEVKDMPVISDEGPVITLSRSKSSVDVKLIYKGGNDSGQYRLLVHSLYTLHWLGQIDLKNGAAEISVPNEYNKAGSILQFSVVDNSNMVVAARLWLNGEVSGAGGYINIGRDAVQPRSSTDIRFAVDNLRSPGKYSLVVRKKEPLEFGDLYIQGLPGWPFTGEIPASEAEREAWLMANLYEPSVINRFIEDFITPEPIDRTINFLPETRGTIVSGIITRGSQDTPVQGETLTLTTFSDNFVYTALSNSTGRFHFVLPQNTRDQDAVISFIRKPAPGTVIEMRPEYDIATPVRLPGELSLSSEEFDYIREMSINQQLNAIFSQPPASDSAAIPQSGGQASGSQFGYPDNTVFIDDFITLPNMREVISEVVPSVNARRNGEIWEIRPISEQLIREGIAPLILLDGLPLTNFNEFLFLPPERFRKIDVFDQVYIHGNATFGGIVNFHSKNRDLAGMTLPEESKLISINMPQNTRYGKLFSIPPDNNTPSLPIVILARTFGSEQPGSVNITAPDNLGEYIISISGFTSGGQWVSLSAPLVVERTAKRDPE